MTIDPDDPVLTTLIDEGCEPDLAFAIADAVAEGKLADSGTKRNGKTVWVVVPPAEEMN